MRVEMNKSVTVKEVVDIDLPYYYGYEVSEDGSYYVYGKIEESRLVQITVRTYPGRDGFDIETSERHVSTCAEFLAPHMASTEAEFLKAKADMLASIQSV
jgi:hypothetical protein